MEVFRPKLFRTSPAGVFLGLSSPWVSTTSGLPGATAPNQLQQVLLPGMGAESIQGMDLRAYNRLLSVNAWVSFPFTFVHSHPRAWSIAPRGRASGCALQLNRFLPETKHPEEGVGIATEPATGREFLQLPGVASSKDDIVGMEGFAQTFNGKEHMALPFFLSQLVQPAPAYVIFQGAVPI